MKKVLIVEDEKLIREGVRVMLQRCEIPIEKILECKNGLEALEIIEKERIDVMITDIRMPKMDGITLVKELQKYVHRPKIIVISGYDDFSFAVDLLRCGAREYLLKPIKRDDIKNIMIRMEEEFQKELDDSGNRKALCYRQIRMLLSSDSILREEIEKIELWICMGKKENYRVICTDYQSAEKSIHDFALFFHDIEGSNVFLTVADKADELISCMLFGYRIGISDEYSGLVYLRQAYNEAKKQRVQAFCMQQLDKEEAGRMDNNTDFLNEAECFVQRIGTVRAEENDRYLQELKKKVKTGKIKGERFQEMILQIIKAVKDLYGGIFNTEGINIDNLHNMLAFSDIDVYCTEISRIFSVVSSKAMGENDDYRNRTKVKEAIAYIKDNYEKDINMAMVSNHVSMNYTMFSIIFKEYTGENFVNYFRNIRMKEAKMLLAETDQKIIRISRSVGYYDVKHFMKTFKSIFGVTPSEYRKNARIRR
jgi:two-component system response regulator YesN